ncbi:MAG: type II toxin-antitoxin system RelE/ParE family toxin [Pirellulaceae bacterium]|nr:type II toxin-antitoxin system RelE/ParE family toxin [Pirellulaceae bacterium]
MTLPDFSPQSLDDLKEVLVFVARDRPQAARQLVQRLKEKCRFLATTPFAGTSRNDLSPGLRAFTVGNYVIYFHPTETGIRVERVLHASRDLDALFFE